MELIKCRLQIQKRKVSFDTVGGRRGRGGGFGLGGNVAGVAGRSYPAALTLGAGVVGGVGRLRSMGVLQAHHQSEEA